MRTKTATVDDYLAALPDDQRAVLEKLRATVLAAAPEATECISYGIPSYKLDGMLVGFGAAADHCALYLMSATAVETHAADLAKYDTGKGTVRFPANKPLPVALVRKLVKARIAENRARRAAKSGAGP